MKPFRAAVIQSAPVLFNKQATLEKADALMAEAAAKGAQLAVFPEAFISAYPKGLDFGAKLGSRTAEGRQWFRKYWESSIDVPGPDTLLLGEMAAKHNLHIVMGVIERDGGTLYCTALFFDSAGVLLGKHRKVMPTALERLVWGFGDGSTLKVMNTELGKMGAVICWENYMPMLRMAMYSQGVEIYCAPTVDDRPSWLPTMQHIATEGRCFVLSAVQHMTAGDLPEDYPVKLTGEIIRGGSVIVNPFGAVLAGPCFDQDTILTADLDPAAILEGKYDLDVTGHYARPDIFRLHVNTRPMPAVRFEEQD